ncbi:MAG: PAS domain S-box protein [Planctomycetes bacterium]|nr:PAS domain S-box protein [Planctomycetota bacterium]
MADLCLLTILEGANWTILFGIMAAGLLLGAAIALLILCRIILPKKIRKETEKLSESVEWLREIFNSSGDGIAIIDKNLEIINVNDRQKQWFPNAKPGKTCYKEFCSRDQEGPCEGCPVLKAIETGEPHSLTVQGTDTRGRPRWHEMLASPLRDEYGRTVAAVETVRNVTKLKLAELEQQMLAEHLRQTHEMVENVSDSVIGTDPDRVITIWNKGAEEIFGYTAKEVKGEKAPMLYPESEQEKVAEFVDKVRAGETVRNVEFQGLRKDGTVVDLLTTLLPVKNPDGEIVAMCGISKDITERKRLEDHLRSQKELQDSLIENANVIIIGSGLNGNLMLLNKKAEKSTGYSKKELLGQDWIGVLIPSEKQDDFRKVVASVQEENFPETYDCPIITKVGIRRRILWHNSALRDKSGAVSGLICIGEEHPDESVGEKLQI